MGCMLVRGGGLPIMYSKKVPQAHHSLDNLKEIFGQRKQRRECIDNTGNEFMIQND